MDFRTLYQEKRTTPDEAVARCLRDGIVCASDIALAHPPAFYDAAARAIDAGTLHEIYHHNILDVAPYPYLRPEYAGKFVGISWFSQANSRKAINAGFCDVMPAYYRDFPAIFRDYAKPEVMILTVSPMDKQGYFSCECSGSVTDALLVNAKVILLEVNKYMLRCLRCQLSHGCHPAGEGAD